MKTKDFIRLLQEADPSGESHVRLPNGSIPLFVDLKRGYDDGGYCYIEGFDGRAESAEDWVNRTLVCTRAGTKVDVTGMDPEEFIFNRFDLLEGTDQYDKTTWRDFIRIEDNSDRKWYERAFDRYEQEAREIISYHEEK